MKKSLVGLITQNVKYKGIIQLENSKSPFRDFYQILYSFE